MSKSGSWMFFMRVIGSASQCNVTSSLLWEYDSKRSVQLCVSKGNVRKSRLQGAFTDSLWLIHTVPFS
jgi:hypothetical protein